jgi:hypothetical protein
MDKGFVCVIIQCVVDSLLAKRYKRRLCELGCIGNIFLKGKTHPPSKIDVFSDILSFKSNTLCILSSLLKG